MKTIKKLNTKMERFILGLGLAVCMGVTGNAAASTVGADAIDRGTADSWSNFVLGLTSEAFTSSGIVTNWEVFTADTGTLGMLLLRPDGGSAYTVVGADFETVTTAGLNSYTFSPDTGSANVQAGDILGLFIGTAKVDFDFAAGGTANWCGGSGCITDVDTQLAAGQSVSLTGGPQDRIYSANVNVVPIPPAAILFGSAVVGITLVARRRAAKSASDKTPFPA